MGKSKVAHKLVFTRQTKREAKTYVATIYNGLAFLHPAMRDCSDIVYAGVESCGMALQFASTRLKNHDSIVVAAVRNCGPALQFASSRLQNNKGLVFLACALNANAFQYASPRLKANRQFVFKMVCQFGEALQYAAPALQNDEAIVLAAIRTGVVCHAAPCYSPLKFASETYRNNKDLVEIAVKLEGLAIVYADTMLQLDQHLIKLAVAQNGQVLELLDNVWKHNLDIVVTAVKQNPWAFDFASTELQLNPAVIAARDC